MYVATLPQLLRRRKVARNFVAPHHARPHALVFAEYFPAYMGSDRRLFDLLANIDSWRIEVAVVPPLRVLASGDNIEEALKERCERHMRRSCFRAENAVPNLPAHYLRLSRFLRRVWSSGLLPVAYALSIPVFLVQAIRLIAKCKPDLVVAGHPSYLCGLVSVLAARLSRVPVLLDYPDAWTPLAVETAQLDPKGLTARVLLVLEAFIARKADRITSITAELAEYVRTTMRAKAPIRIVGNGADDRIFRPDAEAVSRLRFRIPEDHAIAVYSGRLEAWSGTDALVETIKHVTAKRPKTTFVIVGDGNAARKLRESIRAEGLDVNVVFAGYRPFNDMPALIGMADLAIIPFPRTPTTEVCAPIKLYEYMLMKKAVITTALRGIRESVSARQVHLIEDTSAAALAQAILTLLENPEYRADLAAHGYRLAKEHLTWKILAAKFALQMRAAAGLRVWRRPVHYRRAEAGASFGSPQTAVQA